MPSKPLFQTEQDLVQRGLLPRADFQTCPSCPMRSACSTTRSCSERVRNKPAKNLAQRLRAGEASASDLAEAARIVDLYAPTAP